MSAISGVQKGLISSDPDPRRLPRSRRPVATSGCTWRQLPPVFGLAWPTVYRRFAQWSRDRVWARLHRIVLDELGRRGELDWSRCAIDSVSVRAAQKGATDGTESD